MAAIMVRSQSRPHIEYINGIAQPVVPRESGFAKKAKPPPGYNDESDHIKAMEIAEEQLNKLILNELEQSRLARFFNFWWLVFEDPNSHFLGLLWATVIMTLIIISSVCFVIETLPDLCCGRYDHIWMPIELYCISFFTIEYCSRFILCPRHYGLDTTPDAAILCYTKSSRLKASVFARLRFVKGGLNLVDFIAILPFYIDLVLAGEGGNLSFVRVIRLARVFRLFKFGKYSDGLQMLGKTMSMSLRSLGMICGMLLLAGILFSTLIYYIEKGVFCDESNNFCDGTASGEYGWYASPHEYTGSYWDNCDAGGSFCRDRTQFQNIFVSAYWVLTTMTTTGYGDIYPKTPAGQFFGCLIMFSGLLLLALPITIISGNFVSVYEAREYEKLKKIEEAEAEAQRLIREGLVDPSASSKGRLLGKLRNLVLLGSSFNSAVRQKMSLGSLFNSNGSNNSSQEHRGLSAQSMDCKSTFSKSSATSPLDTSGKNIQGTESFVQRGMMKRHGDFRALGSIDEHARSGYVSDVSDIDSTGKSVVSKTVIGSGADFGSDADGGENAGDKARWAEGWETQQLRVDKLRTMKPLPSSHTKDSGGYMGHVRVKTKMGSEGIGRSNSDENEEKDGSLLSSPERYSVSSSIIEDERYSVSSSIIEDERYSVSSSTIEDARGQEVGGGKRIALMKPLCRKQRQQQDANSGAYVGGVKTASNSTNLPDLAPGGVGASQILQAPPSITDLEEILPISGYSELKNGESQQSSSPRFHSSSPNDNFLRRTSAPGERSSQATLLSGMYRTTSTTDYVRSGRKKPDGERRRIRLEEIPVANVDDSFDVEIGGIIEAMIMSHRIQLMQDLELLMKDRSTAIIDSVLKETKAQLSTGIARWARPGGMPNQSYGYHPGQSQT